MCGQFERDMTLFVLISLLHMHGAIAVPNLFMFSICANKTGWLKKSTENVNNYR